jgi:putative aldouronate transport system substrate-binding protein
MSALPNHSRRQFLRLSAVGAAGIALLQACSGAPQVGAPKPATNGTPGGETSGNPLPTYMPPTGGPKPDFQSQDPRITAGFLNYPKEPPKSWTAGPPGSGGSLNVLVAAYYPAPTARDQNPTWKAVEQQLNSTVNMTIVPMVDYATRIQTVMAGGDLPDVIHIVGTAANLIGSQFLQAQMADLTPYLGGDAARDYPNLAAIPQYAYKGAGGVFDNHLYGVPIHRYLPAFWFFRNTDIWDAEIGADTVPKDADDFKRILQQLNRPQESRWAIGNFVQPVGERMLGLTSFLEMFGAPNAWGLDPSGKLVRDRETEEYKAGLSYLKELIDLDLYPPDIQTGSDSRGAYLQGRFVVSNEAFGNGWNDMWRRGMQLNPPKHFTIIKPFSASASVKPQHFITAGTVAYNIVKKGSADRVREIVRVMNYLAAPFGTQEDMLLTYGLRDQDFSVDASGNPAPTQAGIANSQYVPWQYVAHRPYVWYQADLPGYAQAAFDVEQTLVNIGVADPTRGFHSATQSRKGVVADQAFHDGVADILFNRRPFSDFDTLVNDWRTNAGDQIRTEFLAEINASK